MALPVFGDPVQLVEDILKAAFPSATITSDPLQFSQFSVVRDGKQFIVVQETGGSTSSHLLQDNVRFDVQSYTYGDRKTGIEFAYAVQRALFLASFNQFTSGAGHMRRLRTEVRPYRQQLAGIPAQVVRCSATYTFGYRSR
jgi:hypothetical protein